jgi:hypothetical protein
MNRALLLLTALLAAWQVAVGIEGLENIPTIAYTIAFGVLLVAGLLLLILGFEALDSPIVVILSTAIPLALSLGLVWEHLVSLRTPYLVFTLVGFLAVALTRAIPVPGKMPLLIVALVHGIAGWTIFLVPLVIVARGEMKPAFALVSLGGALIGLGGLLLSFLRAGKPLVPRQTILSLLPALLLAMTAAFVFGYALGR